MAVNPACNTFVPMLSPFIDGELPPRDRMSVEKHIGACRDCAMRTADLRAESSLVRVGMEMLADEVDFKDFSQKVMARLTPEKPPLLDRLRLILTETFTYQRRVLFTSMATAAAVLVAALPFILREHTPEGYAKERLEVQAVKTDEGAHVAPVVMETDTGDTIIWTVEHTHPAQQPNDGSVSEELEIEPDAEKPKLKQDAPKGGEL